ncbi:hypothetical protein ACFU8W_23655 [Streptomyces sp. NPDC057565]|uniref:hypothetical protein n=1 Tax=Streptomyces sp. NPDC057565 TaxID=3346169 RepID=UPI0036C5041E
MLNTLTLGGGREIYAELHHDGSVVLAVNLSWKAIREGLLGEAPEEALLLHQDFVGECCRDLAAVAVELARRLRVDSALYLTAAIAAAAPAASLAVVVSEYGGCELLSVCCTEVSGGVRERVLSVGLWGWERGFWGRMGDLGGCCSLGWMAGARPGGRG